MVLIKPILIVGLLLACGCMAISFRSRLFVRIVIVGFLAGGFVFILFPELANAGAHLVGVGRGADLWLYLQSLLIIFVALALYRRALAHERAIAEIIRAMAIASVRVPDSGESARADS